MRLNVPVHNSVLFQILKDVYTDTAIAPFLGFKGETAAFMHYGLSRFSVDLDFDLLDKHHEDVVCERMGRILKSYGVLREASRKRFGDFFLLSYEAHARTIKVEINRRSWGSLYDVNTCLGVSMLVMVKGDMFAHKLMAMNERIGRASRDVYDVWYFLRNNWPINKAIVEQRAEVPFAMVLQKSIHTLEKFSNKKILQGLGELLTPSRKDWARAKLLADTIFLLKLRLEIEERKGQRGDG
jgi:predicted nucleotidyltransferase component of viral defense system